MKIYYIVASNGDGSSRVEFYDSKECIDYLCDDKTGSEEYWDGDGGSWGEIEITGEVVQGTGYSKIVNNFEECKAEQDERNSY